MSSPVVIAILLSLLLNVLGWQEALDTLPFTGGVMATLGFLANLTIPLILIIVGYGIKFDRQGFGDASRLVIIRLAILLPLCKPKTSRTVLFAGCRRLIRFLMVMLLWFTIKRANFERISLGYSQQRGRLES